MRELYIIILALVTFSCDIDQQEEAVLTILADRTDAHILNPEVDDIRALIDLDRSPNMGVNIYFQNLGNVDYSPLSTIAIASFLCWITNFSVNQISNDFIQKSILWWYVKMQEAMILIIQVFCIRSLTI